MSRNSKRRRDERKKSKAKKRNKRIQTSVAARLAKMQADSVFVDLEAGLADFPNLRAIIPQSFPRGAEYAISSKKMREYSDARSRKYWHQLNLPLLINAARHVRSEKARSLLRSVLRALDDFAVAFGQLKGARSLLAPLWEDLWTDTPQLWSIVACAYMALCYRNDAIEVIGFETPIGDGAKDDITVRLDGKITHVEVEAFHRAKFGVKTDDEIEALLEGRADTKAKKFRAISPSNVGVVAIVCVVADEDVQRSRAVGLRRVKRIPGRPGNVMWTATRLVGVAQPDGLRFAIMPF